MQSQGRYQHDTPSARVLDPCAPYLHSYRGAVVPEQPDETMGQQHCFGTKLAKTHSGIPSQPQSEMHCELLALVSFSVQCFVQTNGPPCSRSPRNRPTVA